MTFSGSRLEFVDCSDGLVQPAQLSIDSGLSDERARHLVRVAQLLYTFWNTGDPAFLSEAVDGSFVDHTLPPGRPQGMDGPLSASAAFRTAVPDLTCELADLLIVGDKLAARLRFRGHFTGVYNGVAGNGQTIDFAALDIQQVGDHKIIADWHLEDNLTFLRQVGRA